MDPNAETLGHGGPSGPVPAMIARYRVLGLLGEGGFGVVYEAEQAEPVRRRVAIKVIKPGMDSAGVIARFEAERQALAVMDHPCIAKVFDGGVTGPEQGSRPYFVMELVRGEPITEFCDRHTLGIEDRVELFIRVCEAVQHAHAKGVIHRDLKPSNILVSYDGDGRAEPKVIDFGVAKALNQRLTERTIFTERGQLIGTPEYMSPEQAEMSGLDVDTRADVYSLGVVLYELLTGVLPFDPKALRQAAYHEIQRIIREVEPPRPSTRLSTVLTSGADEATRIMRARHTDPRSLTGALRRDLDWVVMRCLEKDRERRYATATALGEELARFLAGEPVSAGPPGVGYRVRKFVGRHRLGVATAGVGLLLLVTGIGAIALALDRAQQERARLERVVSFIEGPMLRSEHLAGAGRNATMPDVLAQTAAIAPGALADDPVVSARVLAAIGVGQVHLGDHAASGETLDRSLAYWTTAGPAAHWPSWRWDATLGKAESMWRSGRAGEAVSFLQAVDTSGADARRTGEWLMHRAAALKWGGRLDEADAAYAEAVAHWQATDGPSAATTLTARYDAALVLLERGKLAERSEGAEGAEPYFRSSLQKMLPVLELQRATLGDDHEQTLATVLEVATLRSRLGHFEEAAALFDEAIAGLSRRLGAVHWRTLQARANLGSMRYRQGDFARAIEAYEPVLDAYAAAGRLGSPEAFVVARACAKARARLGDPLGGIPRLSAVHAQARARSGAGGVDPALVAADIAGLYEQAGDAGNAARWRESP